MSTRVIPLAEVDDALVEDWRRLGRQALEPNPFAEADFVLPAHRWLGSGDRVVVLVVERDRELQLVLPAGRVRHFRRIPIPAFAAWTNPYSFLGTPLLAAWDPEDAWAEALTVMKDRAPWAVLEQLGSDGPVAAALAAAQAGRGRTLTSLELPARPVLRRANGDYLNRLSASRRSKIRRLRPRLAGDCGGEVRVLDYPDPGPDLEDAIDGFLAMEAGGWKGIDGGAMACHPGHAEFFREVCRRFAGRGSLQMRALRVGSKTIGYQCNLVAGDTLFGFKTTFDETFRRYSPGVVLLVDTIANFHANQALEVYDSCMGPSPSPVRDLFLDARAMVDALVSTQGLLGEAATRLAPGARTAYRHAGTLGRAVKSQLAARPAADA